MPDKMSVQWAGVAGGGPHIVAFVLKDKVFYQMDAWPAPSGPFAWSTEVLQKIPLQAAYVGIVIYSDSDTVLPARLGPIGATGPVDRGDRYQIVLWPEQHFRAVTRTLRQVNADGARKIIISDEELGLGFYPNKRAIPFSIPVPPAGNYELVISGSFETDCPPDPSQPRRYG